MATHESRNTTTGLKFEEKVYSNKKLNRHGINVTKYNLYKYMESMGIDWETILSRKLLPDEAYLDFEASELRVYEKKYQETEGSADEKPQTCGFKIWEFTKIAKILGVSKATYTYVFSDWFKDPRYKDTLEYIKNQPGCDYFFEND